MKISKYKLCLSLLLMVSTLFIEAAAFAGGFGVTPEGGWTPPVVPPAGVTLKGEVVLIFSDLHQCSPNADPLTCDTVALPELAYAKALVGLVNNGGQLVNDDNSIERHQKSPDRHGFYVDLGEVRFTDSSGLINLVLAKLQPAVLKDFFNRTKNLKETVTNIGVVYTATVPGAADYSDPWGTWTYDGNWLPILGASTVVDVEIVVEKVPAKH